MNDRSQRAFVLLLLALLMTATRINHFAPVPDASWAVFFLGGLYLRAWTRWAFPLLMALAVVIDWLVISAQGLAFWQHYCVSPGYVALVPAYLALWTGGAWLRGLPQRTTWMTLARGAAVLVVSVALCHLIAQGAFYWSSRSVAEPSVAGWLKNYSDWFAPYLRTTCAYVAAALLVHAGARAAARRAAPRAAAH
ncbi:hypothetical protein P6166_13330 [Stenotrophomonas sp. HITSZ_GD]|uniref:hypothetical protein n=1 Tax=Stenotrophomonas sp. HITSZ_GD TaxID=3037248 RepID=UPI00240E71E8|nr:hypothetical protein [Stenotrophomonas sp. HITSZ_GD]MDG2526337.1 hypothetical protein [Stenotrophomonas sp. HITSZ_GD]